LGGILTKEELKIFEREKGKMPMNMTRTEKIERSKKKRNLQNNIEVKK
jgi:uncharacterized protein YbcI